MDREVVFSFDEGASFFYVARYNLLTLMVPGIVDLFEFVWVYPCSDLFVVLWCFFRSDSCSCKYFVREYRDTFVVLGPLIIVGSP